MDYELVYGVKKGQLKEQHYDGATRYSTMGGYDEQSEKRRLYKIASFPLTGYVDLSTLQSVSRTPNCLCLLPRYLST